MDGHDRPSNELTRGCYLDGLLGAKGRSFGRALQEARKRAASLPHLRRSLAGWILVETTAAGLAVLWEASRLGWTPFVVATLGATVVWAGFLWWIFDLHLPLVRRDSQEPLEAFGLPNALTTLRMLFVPPMVLFLAQPRAFGEAALALLIGLWAVGLTDVLDGQIARRFHWTTVFGRDIDPVADIVVTSTTILSLAWAGFFPAWLAGLVALRYLGALLGFLFLLLNAKPVRIRGTIAGKMTTPSVQVLAFILAYDRLAESPMVSRPVEHFLALAVGAVILFNIAYLVWYAFFSDARHKGQNQPSR